MVSVRLAGVDDLGTFLHISGMSRGWKRVAPGIRPASYGQFLKLGMTSSLSR